MGGPALPIGMAAMIAGGLLQAKGQLDAGSAAKAQGDYEADILTRNARQSEAMAVDAKERGVEAVDRNQLQTGQLEGRQRALLAANGVLVDSGSGLDVVSDTARVGRQQSLDLERNAEREAMMFRMQAFNQRADADIRKFTGRQRKQASKIAALGSLLGSGGNIAALKAGA